MATEAIEAGALLSTTQSSAANTAVAGGAPAVAAPTQKQAVQSFGALSKAAENPPAAPAKKTEEQIKQDFLQYQTWLYQVTLLLSGLALVATLLGLMFAGCSLLAPKTICTACFAAFLVGTISTLLVQQLVGRAYAEAKETLDKEFQAAQEVKAKSAKEAKEAKEAKVDVEIK
jgi:hypothetical protein